MSLIARKYYGCVSHNAMDDTQDTGVILQSITHKDGSSFMTYKKSFTVSRQDFVASYGDHVQC
jgi:hypothetical protein